MTAAEAAAAPAARAQPDLAPDLEHATGPLLSAALGKGGDSERGAALAERPVPPVAAAPRVPQQQAPRGQPGEQPWLALEVSLEPAAPLACGGLPMWFNNGGGGSAKSGGGGGAAIGAAGGWGLALGDLDGRVAALCAFSTLMAVNNTALRATLPSYVDVRVFLLMSLWISISAC